MLNIVLVHIGDTIPDYLYDCIYQCLLINQNSCKIYVIINDDCIYDFNSQLSNMNIDLFFDSTNDPRTSISTIPISILDKQLSNITHWSEYTNTIHRFDHQREFRNGFWIHTTSRFFYIEALMTLYNISSVFHIENDIMMYQSFVDIHSQLPRSQICMVQDSPNRVIPSILFFPTSNSITELNCFITTETSNSNYLKNDMELLGSFDNKYTFPIFPSQSTFLYDGAAIGQYLGGIDVRNLCNTNSPESIEMLNFVNPSIGFINETSDFKPNLFKYDYIDYKLPNVIVHLKKPVCITNEPNVYTNIANLHIHSKQLYQFSSVFNIKFSDIITGDRIVSLCDFVISTNDIYNYHKNIDKYAKDIINIKDWDNVNVDLLNIFFNEFCSKHNTATIKLFVYTHILSQFQQKILKYLDPLISFVLYTHNSDHSFNDSFQDLLQDDKIKHVYAQNIDYSFESTKLTLLPIGIANSMWEHGDLQPLYSIMKSNFKKPKQKDLYVNINPNTFDYRNTLLNTILKTKCWEISEPKPYIEYLKDLSLHRFSLCIRGNGIDTHRFWESLYLGVIPVVVDNSKTNICNFLKYVKKQDIPCIVIKDEDDYKICKNKFDDTLYKKVLKFTSKSLYNINSLKLKTYA